LLQYVSLMKILFLSAFFIWQITVDIDQLGSYCIVWRFISTVIYVKKLVLSVVSQSRSQVGAERNRIISDYEARAGASTICTIFWSLQYISQGKGVGAGVGVGAGLGAASFCLTRAGSGATSADIQEMEPFPGRSRSIDTICRRYCTKYIRNFQEMEHFPQLRIDNIYCGYCTVYCISVVIKEMGHFPRPEPDHWYPVPSLILYRIYQLTSTTY
jgi:hypothetical protein